MLSTLMRTKQQQQLERMMTALEILTFRKTNNFKTMIKSLTSKSTLDN